MRFSTYTYLLLSGVLFACNDDFLLTAPQDFVSPDNYLTSESQVEILVNGVYNNIDFGGATDPYQKVYPFIYDVMTDNAFNRSPWENATDFARGTVNPDNARVQWKWDQNYQGIARANSLLSALDKNTTIDKSKIQRYVAEVKFLRAWYYADLINFFGDVPLLLEPGDLSNSQPSRSPVGEIQAQVLKDLDEAIPDLPIRYTDAKDNGRITRGAALAFKARVLLYDQQWEKAAGVAKEVMDLGIYSLFPDYWGLFQETNEAEVSNTEAIFQVYYTPQINPSFFNTPLMEWWPSYLPTLQLVDAYYMANGLPITDPASGYDSENPHMNRDPRFAASIYYPGAPWQIAFMNKNGRFEENWILGGGGFKPKKFIDPNLMDLANGQGTNKLFIRYAEVLLTYAEAQNEATGPDATVYDAIDQLRIRAGMTTLSEAMPGLSQAEMRDVIRNERRIELVFEGLRLMDIRRWKIGEQVMTDALGYDHTYMKDMSYPGDGKGTTSDWKYIKMVIDYRTFNPNRDYLWPIPQREMNSNKNMRQNPNY